MLNSPTGVVLTKGNIGLKPYQIILFDHKIRSDQYYQDVGRIKHRLEKFTPNMQRSKTSKSYERRFIHDRNRFNGLSQQIKQELQRLRTDGHNLAKIISLPSISQPPSFYQHRELTQNRTPRLSAITEENSRMTFVDKPQSVLDHLPSMNPSRTTLNHLPPTQKRSSSSSTNSSTERYHSLYKHSFQQVIAKTSDDRPYLQQQAHLINQQKRLTAQKLKAYLH